MTPVTKLNSPQELDALKQKAAAAIKSCATRVLVCGGTGCMANGAPAVVEALQNALDERGIPVRADIMSDEDEKAINLGYSGCPGYCQVGPIVRILPSDYFYIQVTPEDAADIVEQTVMNGKPVDRLLSRSDDGS